MSVEQTTEHKGNSLVKLMADLHSLPLKRKALLVYYSLEARQHLEAALECVDLQVTSVDGRAPQAAEELRRHPAKVVLVDRGPLDVSVSQTVRQVGQMLPDSLVITVSSSTQAVELYRAGHLIGVAQDLKSALLKHAFPLDLDRDPNQQNQEE